MAEERRSRNPGNFAEDRERAAREAASAACIARATLPTIASGLRKLGAKAGRRAMLKRPVPGARRKTRGNFEQDRDRASVTGPKGGQTSD